VISIVKIIQGKLSPKNISGPIGIATIIGEKAEQGILSIISLMAFLSLSLGVINLAPIPILDGGHIMFFAIEAIIRKPFSLHQREVAQQVGMILLILLMVFVFSNDIRRIIGS
jgi:regulator of sigma E protease